MENNNTLAYHQSVLRTSETEDINTTVHRQFLKRQPKCRTGIGQTRTVHVYIHSMCVCQLRNGTQFVGLVYRTQLRTLRKVNGSRLRMVLFAEVAQIRPQEFGRQLPVRSRYWPDLTACHTGRSATLIHVDVGRLGTEYQVVRTCTQLQGNSIATGTVEHKQDFAIGRKGFAYLAYGFFRPGIITVAHRMVFIGTVQGVHHQRMHT